MIEWHTAFMQIFTIGVTGIFSSIGLAITSKSSRIGTIVAISLFGGLCAGLRVLTDDTQRLSVQIQEIEAEINRRANDRLLTWESTRGLWRGATRGH
jgi:hypothetical protein